MLMLKGWRLRLAPGDDAADAMGSIECEAPGKRRAKVYLTLDDMESKFELSLVNLPGDNFETSTIRLLDQNGRLGCPSSGRVESGEDELPERKLDWMSWTAGKVTRRGEAQRTHSAALYISIPLP